MFIYIAIIKCFASSVHIVQSSQCEAPRFSYFSRRFFFAMKILINRSDYKIFKKCKMVLTLYIVFSIINVKISLHLNLIGRKNYEKIKRHG